MSLPLWTVVATGMLLCIPCLDTAAQTRPASPSSSVATRPLSDGTAPSTPSAVAVGELIFHDKNLSEPRGTSCASCHDAKLGFSGTNGAKNGVTQGPSGQAGLRSSMSTTYMGFVPPFEFRLDVRGMVRAFGGYRWDGAGMTLHTQSRGPLLVGPLMNLPSREELAARIATSSYASLFRQTYGAQVLNDPHLTFEKVGEALAAFQTSTTAQPFTSKFDAVLQKKASFTPAEQRGMELFRQVSKGNCVACHSMNPDTGRPQDSMFSNYAFYALGVPRNPAIAANANPDFFDVGLCGPIRPRPVVPMQWREKLGSESLCGQFRTTSLRNVAERPSFMHNGVFTNLMDVMRFYASRNSQPKKWYGPKGIPNDLPPQYLSNLERTIPPFNRKPTEGDALTEAEMADIVAFMQTLSDGYQAQAK